MTLARESDQYAGSVLQQGYWTPTEPASNEETMNFMRDRQGGAFWYLASPYSKYPGGHDAACRDAAICGAYCLDMGVKVFVPITHSHPIVQAGLKNDTHEMWLALDHSIMQFAVGICVCKLPGWEESKWVGWERKQFAEMGKPEVFLRWNKEKGVVA